MDTCCINKASDSELTEAITSIFRWYRDAKKCYVYLTDVSTSTDDDNSIGPDWQQAFRRSRWFTRGWTLQGLIAPKSVEFFSKEGALLGSKTTLEQPIHEITTVPIDVLSGALLSQFPTAERMRWTTNRNRAYYLLGIFNVFMPLLYGEGDNAFIRLEEELDRSSQSRYSIASTSISSDSASDLVVCILTKSRRDFSCIIRDHRLRC